MNRLRKLLFKLNRSKGDFQIQRYEEEEELFSVHIRRCLMVWISLSIIVEIIREAFFYQVSALYEPFMLFGLVIVYHFFHLKGEKWLLGGRITFVLLPMFLFIFSGYRMSFRSLMHEMEVALADQGLVWFHVTDFNEIGIGCDFVIVFLLLWGIFVFYELGKKQEWLLVILPTILSIWLFFVMGWEPDWWIYPGLLAEAFLILMPAVTAWGVITVFMLVAVSVLTFTLNNTGNNESAIWRGWQNWRYGVEKKALPEGDMSKASKMVRDKRVALQVRSKSQDSYYLRGFIGNLYDGNTTWHNNRQAVRTLEMGVWGTQIDVVDILHRKGYYGNGKLTEHNKIRTLDSYYFQVNNMAANRKYLYLPYESKTAIKDFVEDKLAVNGAAESLYATSIGGQDSYQCKAVVRLAGNTANIMEEGDLENIQKVQLNQRKQWKPSSQKSSEEVYQDYVERVDLALPKKTKSLIAEQLSDYSAVRNISPQGAYETIKRWLRSNVKYVETPASIPKDEEFLPWFLKVKEGNDVYQASVATMMFRYLGIPARYVEGYLYEPSSQSETTRVLQSDAHAWVEIYVKDLGWIPVEVTEEYEDFTKPYLPNYQAVSKEIAKSEDSEEEEEKSEDKSEEKTEEEKPSGGEKGESDTQQEEASPSESKYNWNALVKFLLYVLVRLIAVITILVSIVLLFYTLSKLIRHYYKEIRWKRSAQTAVCISEWYRHLMMHLYLLENVKDKNFEEWDNRNEKVHKLLLKYDKECSRNTLASRLEIYRRALFSEEVISWAERKRYVHFCEREMKKLRKQMSMRQKMRLIFDDVFN